jgi:hypothetical protein
MLVVGPPQASADAVLAEGLNLDQPVTLSDGVLDALLENTGIDTMAALDAADHRKGLAGGRFFSGCCFFRRHDGYLLRQRI